MDVLDYYATTPADFIEDIVATISLLLEIWGSLRFLCFWLLICRVGNITSVFWELRIYRTLLTWLAFILDGEIERSLLA